MASTWQLYKLQQFDTQIDELNKKLKALDPGAGLRQEKETLEKAVKESSEKPKTAQIKFKDKELKLQSMIDQRKKVEDKLYKGGSTNLKELACWQEDFKSLRKQIDSLETEALEDMEKVEVMAAEHGAKQIQLEQLEKQIKEKEANYQQELKELNAQIENNQALREKMATQIEEEILQKYEDLRARKDGLAVVKLSKATCGGCYMNLPAPTLNRVKARLIEFCDHCGRILHPDNE